MHPSARLREAKTRLLRGRRIVLGVSGSIAAVESVKVAHELIRHGATVLPVMTTAAAQLLGPMALEYATGRAPIIHLSGAAEHVQWLDGPGRADLLLLAPATANTIAKVALGIDDTALTSMASVALGSGVPILVAPAMHEVMARNAALERRIRELRKANVGFIEPRQEEGKAKIATPEDIAEACIHRLATGPWVGKRALVISGSTAEAVDPVRVLTNRSSGRMGVALATALHRAGADVELWNAWGSVPLPTFASVRRFETVAELQRLVQKRSFRSLDAVFMPAALGDFAPKPYRQKIPSDAPPPSVVLSALPKILPLVRKKAPKAVVVGFKAESDAKTLVARAEQRRKAYGVDLMVGNTSRTFGSLDAAVHLVSGRGRPKIVKGSKDVVAARIVEAAASFLRR